MNWPVYSTLILPYTRREWLGYGKLMKVIGVYREDAWANAPALEIRGKLHGYRMVMDLTDLPDRMGYFLGRFYDLATQLFIIECVRPGDTFVDIGANIGMLTLLAARLVGPEGRVEAFEPNPEVYRRLSHNVQRNRLQNVSLHAVGLGDKDADLTLRVWAKNKGWGTFGTLAPDEMRQLSSEYQTRVLKGDDVLDIRPGGRVIIKIDVEGYECHVLRGLDRTLCLHDPIVITEVLESTLRRAGSTAHQLFSIMRGHGYHPFAIEAQRRFLKHHLVMRPVSDERQLPALHSNVVWLRQEGIHSGRLCAQVFRP